MPSESVAVPPTTAPLPESISRAIDDIFAPAAPDGPVGPVGPVSPVGPVEPA